MTRHPYPALRPVAWLPGRHLRTIVPALWPAPPVPLPVESIEVEVAPHAAVRVDVSRPRGSARGTIVLVHGLGGSAESRYMRRTARHALERGWVAARMNLRTCGGTEALSSTLYNAGQSDDLAAVLEALRRNDLPRPLAALGFSLGGNVVLRYAGMAGTDSLADAVAAVNAPVDLAACADAIDHPSNAIYRWYFVRVLCAHVRRIRRLRPVPGPPAVASRVRTLRAFDAAFTAPDAGDPSAEAYYVRASARRVLPSIGVPGLLLTAADDPFVPATDLERAAAGCRSLETRIVPRGGHVGYWHAGTPRFWAASALVSFFETAQARAGASARARAIL